MGTEAKTPKISSIFVRFIIYKLKKTLNRIQKPEATAAPTIIERLRTFTDGM